MSRRKEPVEETDAIFDIALEEMKAVENATEQVDALLQEFGGKILLKAVGKSLQDVSGTFTAPAIGKAIEALAEVEW